MGSIVVSFGCFWGLKFLMQKGCLKGQDGVRDVFIHARVS